MVVNTDMEIPLNVQLQASMIRSGTQQAITGIVGADRERMIGLAFSNAFLITDPAFRSLGTVWEMINNEPTLPIVRQNPELMAVLLKHIETTVMVLESGPLWILNDPTAAAMLVRLPSYRQAVRRGLAGMDGFVASLCAATDTRDIFFTNHSTLVGLAESEPAMAYIMDNHPELLAFFGQNAGVTATLLSREGFINRLLVSAEHTKAFLSSETANVTLRTNYTGQAKMLLT
jgi:hypothetical protein